MHSELTGSSFRPIGAFAWPPPHPTPKPPRAQISYCSEHLLSSSQQIEERRRGGGNQRRKQEARREKKYSRAKQRGKRLEAPSTPLKHCSSPHRPPLSPTPPPPSVGQLTHSHTWHRLKKTKQKLLSLTNAALKRTRRCQGALHLASIGVCHRYI